MRSSSFHLLAAAALATFSLGNQAQAALAYSLSNSGGALIRFDTATPNVVTVVNPLSGINHLDGLDFRPSNGLLYGYSDATNSVYLVDRMTGVVTLVTAISNPTNASALGIDFNPVADRLRIVDVIDQNLRVDVAGGATTVDGALTYAAGDPKFGLNPRIIDAAYTNSGPGIAASTMLFYIDTIQETLVSTTNPNGGVLNTVGPLGVNFSDFTAFDIYTHNGIDFAFAESRVNDVNGLYSINLATGSATLVGLIGNNSFLYGLAIAPDATVPEPGSLALLGVAGLAALLTRRRRFAPITDAAARDASA